MTRRTYTVACVGVPSVISFSPKALVLPVQEHGDNDLLALAGETRAKVVGDGLRGLEGKGRQISRHTRVCRVRRQL